MGKRLTVILGAGASCDLIPDPKLGTDAEFRPPLVTELFDYRKSFADILKNYPRVTALTGIIRTRIEQGETVETILQAVRDSGDELLVRLFRHVPLYLQDLFNTISEKYTLEPTNYNRLMADIFSPAYDRVALVTLNYDLFLEKSLEEIDGPKPRRIGDYVSPGQKWMLIKLHGSVNWGRRLRDTPDMRRIDDASAFRLLDQVAVEERQFGEIEVIPPMKRWIDHDFVYPAMTLPVEGKFPVEGNYKYSCPEDHIETLKEFLSSCPNYLIIGVSGKDQDLLHLLKENVRTWGAVTIVGLGQKDVHTAWGRFQDAIRQLHALRVLPIVYEEGFSKFITSGKLEESLGRVQ